MSQSNPANRSTLIVDVDETLFDTTPRKIAILHDLFGIPATYEEVSADYYLTDYLHSPKQERDFFREFHSGKYIHFDIAIDCAPQVLQRLSAKLSLVYLTGRHAEGAQPWMAQKSATLQSLKRFGFPLPEDQNTFLIMKQYFSGFESAEIQAAQDYEHKMQVTLQLVAQSPVVAGISDSFSDLLVYSAHGVFPICLKRPHFRDLNRLGELAIRPFVADDWLAVESRVLELLKQKSSPN